MARKCTGSFNIEWILSSTCIHTVLHRSQCNTFSLFVFLFRRYLTKELIWHGQSSTRPSKMVFLLFAVLRILKELVFPFKYWVLNKGITDTVFLNVIGMTRSLVTLLDLFVFNTVQQCFPHISPTTTHTHPNTPRYIVYQFYWHLKNTRTLNLNILLNCYMMKL